MSLALDPSIAKQQLNRAVDDFHAADVAQDCNTALGSYKNGARRVSIVASAFARSPNLVQPEMDQASAAIVATRDNLTSRDFPFWAVVFLPSDFEQFPA
jgi:hypothetical protein